MLKSMTITALVAFGLTMATTANAEVSPGTIDGATTVDAAAAKALFDKGAIFVDVRKDSDWDAGRIPGSHHIELKKAYSEAALGEAADKSAEVVLYCNGEKCLRSSKAATQAVSWGFTKVSYFRDGMPAWEAAGYPVE